MRKKILSVLLSVCMVLTLMPAVAFAAGGDSVVISEARVTSPANSGITVTTGSAIGTATTVSGITLSGDIIDPGAAGKEYKIEADYSVITGQAEGESKTTSGAVIIKSIGSGSDKTLEVTDKVTGKADQITFGEGEDAFVAGIKSEGLSITEAVTYTVSGTVNRGTGVAASTTISGITVNLYDSTDGKFETPVGTATTDADGRYTISNVPDGKYVAVVAESAGNYARSQVNITVNGADVTADIKLLAPLKDAYAINLTVVDDTRGTVEISGATQSGSQYTAARDASVTVTATPKTGYELASVTVINDKNGTVAVSSEEPYTFTMPASDVNITVVFRETNAETYDININAIPADGGTVTADYDKAAEGTKVTITATANGGYNVSSVTVTNLETNSVLVLSNNNNGTYTFTMPAAKVQVIAIFAESNIQVEAGKTEAVVDENAGLQGEDLSLAENVADTAAGATSTGLNKALTDKLTTNDEFVAKTEDGSVIGQTEAKAALTREGLHIADDDVLIVVEPYLDIKIVNADAATNIVTLDISAMYNIKATTAANAAAMDENNSAVVSEGQKLDTGNSPIEITVPLPSRILEAMAADKTYYAKHTKGSDIWYHKLIKNANSVKFVNNKGFSDFELPVEENSVPVEFDNNIGEKILTNAEVGEALPEPVLSSGYTFNGWKFYTDSAKTTAVPNAAGTYKNLTPALFNALNDALTGEIIKIYAVADTAYNGGSSSGGGGGGGSSATTYTVSVTSSVDNGKINVSPKSAAKGSTVTITATPDEGYKVGTITVTDKDGNEIEVKDAGDGKYTFVMPASRVEISATFVEDDGKEPTDPTDPTDPTQPTTAYSDVAATAWYYDAVVYVTNNGLMNGVGNDRFAPNSNLTRAMFAQILYNKAGQPAAGASTFTDVAAGQWYTDAIAWAAAQGVVNGIGNNMFGPNHNITREQLAVMLYRYAGSPAVSGGVTGFNDAGQISSYATSAMAWATTNGVMNGKGDGRLDPKGLATRAEVAQMMQNYFK